MTTGTGIAIAGVWIFVGLAWCSKTVTGGGAWVALLSAALITWLVI